MEREEQEGKALGGKKKNCRCWRTKGQSQCWRSWDGSDHMQDSSLLSVASLELASHTCNHIDCDFFPVIGQPEAVLAKCRASHFPGPSLSSTRGWEGSKETDCDGSDANAAFHTRLTASHLSHLITSTGTWGIGENK